MTARWSSYEVASKLADLAERDTWTLRTRFDDTPDGVFHVDTDSQQRFRVTVEEVAR